jgi:FkbM family methyltransferase
MPDSISKHAKMNRFLRLLSKLTDRRDLWGNPVKAVVRHHTWRRHWKRGSPPYFVVPGWREGITIALPETSNARLAYCGRHPEASVLAAINGHLVSGAVFIDVGAHIGVYSLVAARRVGAHGQVYAIEPQTVGIAALQLSAALNGFGWLQSIHAAVGSRSGEIMMDYESFGAAVAIDPDRGKGGIPVRCWSLDDFAQENRLDMVHLLKLDAAGREADVLRGAGRLLGECRLRAIVMKLYHPDVVHQRCGGTTADAVEVLHAQGYVTQVVFHGKTIDLRSPADLERYFADGSYCHVLLASPHRSSRNIANPPPANVIP